MNSESCQTFLNDPENHTEHVRSCPRCAALMSGLEPGALQEPSGSLIRTFAPESLPIAEWEGAAHRNWPLVFLTGLAIVAAAAIGFMAAGISPVAGVSQSIQAMIPTTLSLRLAQHFGNSLHRAPMSFHVMVLFSFVTVNLLLVLLLKRSPKGVDASTE